MTTFLSLQLLLLLLPETEGRPTPALCTMNDFLQTQYQYYQPGDLVLGGMTSQYFSISDRILFDEHPKRKLVDEAV